MPKPTPPPPTTDTKVKGNYAPDAANDAFSFSTAELSVSEFVISKAALLANDTDANKGDTLTIIAAEGTRNALVQIERDGDLHVFPANTLNPDVAFTYTISDGKGGTDTATVTVDYTLPNHAPVAGDTVVVVDGPREIYTVTFAELLANDTDPDGDRLTVIPDSITGGGRWTDVDVTFLFLYDPDDPTGSTNPSGYFEYTISDGRGGTDTGSWTFL